MIEDELVKIWQSSPEHERVKFAKAKLMIEVQTAVDEFDRKIKYRDLVEQVAIILGIPVFAYYAYSIPYPITKLASVLIILWGVYVFVRIRGAKKHRPSAFTETYLDYLYKTREHLKIQQGLLDNILYWYILPAVVFMFLFILGPGLAGRLPKVIKMGVGIIVIAVATYWLNKRAVKKQFVPRLQKIEALIKVMENG